MISPCILVICIELRWRQLCSDPVAPCLTGVVEGNPLSRGGHTHTHSLSLSLFLSLLARFVICKDQFQFTANALFRLPFRDSCVGCSCCSFLMVLPKEISVFSPAIPSISDWHRASFHGNHFTM